MRDLARPQDYAGLAWDSPLAVGLQHCWPLDGQSLWTDLVSGDPLTPSSGHKYEFQGHGILGQTLYLPASYNSSVLTTGGLADLAAPWTVHFWWQRRANSSGQMQLFAKVGSLVGIKPEQYYATGYLGFTYGSTNGDIGVQAPVGRPVPITYAQGASTLSIYVDGQLRGTINTSGSFLPRTHIGNFPASLGDTAVTGHWGHLCVWNRELPLAEVQLLHHPGTQWDLLWVPSRRVYLAVGGGGGSVFPLSLGGTITPAGATTKNVAALKAGAIAPAAAILRATAKGLAGAVTPSGVPTKSGAKTLAGGVSPAGVADLFRAVVRGVSGTLTTAGVVLLAPAKAVGGAVAPAGAIAKAANQVLGGGVTPAGAVATVRAVLRSVGGALAPSGAILRAAAKGLGGVVTPAGVVAKADAKPLGGSVAPTGAVSVVRAILRTFTGATTPTGALARAASLVRAGVVLPTGTRLKGAATRLAGALAPSGAVAIGRAYLRSLAGSVGPSGALRKTITLARSGSIGPVGQRAKAAAVHLAGAVTAAGVAALFVPTGPTVLWATAAGDVLRATGGQADLLQVLALNDGILDLARDDD